MNRMKTIAVAAAILFVGLTAASHAQDHPLVRPTLGRPIRAEAPAAEPIRLIDFKSSPTDSGPRLIHLQEPNSNDNKNAPLPKITPSVIDSKALPINLATAFSLAGADPLDIAIAEQRVQIACAELQRAKVLWLPTILFGVDYFRHDGKLQDVEGKVFNANKSTFMLGATPNVVFAVTDAIYAPLSARQVLRARQADAQAARNDVLLAVADAYFQVQNARGEWIGATDALHRTEDLYKRVEALAGGLSPAVEKNRVLTELARRRQAIEAAQERWQVAGAELNRLLRLDPLARVEPVEPPHMQLDIVDAHRTVDDLIPLALANRPELAAHQALVQATLHRLKQEKMRPLVPSVLIRGTATNPAGTLAGGYFGGGTQDNLSNFGARGSFDVQLLWEFQNLGLGNRALVRQRSAENQLAMLELFRMQDRVAADVAQAHAQVIRAGKRIKLAEDQVKNARETAESNLEGLKQTRNIGGTVVLVIRPFEAVASVQALELAYRDYYTAVSDLNRAQFRLYRALGQPAQALPTAKIE